MRRLLHLGGHVDYTTGQITVARALDLLTQELNDTPARLAGDRRPLTYQVTPA